MGKRIGGVLLMIAALVCAAFAVYGVFREGRLWSIGVVGAAVVHGAGMIVAMFLLPPAAGGGDREA
jgi:hypothetical protein